MHEHLFIDLVGRRESSAVTEQDRERWNEPIQLSNYYDVRRYKRFYRQNRFLSSVDDAIDEVAEFRAAGGTCIVEVTSQGLGRKPGLLQDVSRASGVHIVMGSGYYTHDYHPTGVAKMTEEEMRDQIVRELTEGVADGGPSAGIIGEIGLSWPVHRDEKKVLRSAAQAQKITGAAITVHPGRHPDAPEDALRVIEAAGGELNRVIMGHLERTLSDRRDLLRLAERGCYLEFDMFGQESSYYDYAPIDMPNDAARVNLLMALGAHGHWHQVLISQDICLKVHLRRYGGEGYAHILQNVCPLMLRKGISRTQVDQLLIRNPANALAF